MSQNNALGPGRSSSRGHCRLISRTRNPCRKTTPAINNTHDKMRRENPPKYDDTNPSAKPTTSITAATEFTGFRPCFSSHIRCGALGSNGGIAAINPTIQCWEKVPTILIIEHEPGRIPGDRTHSKEIYGQGLARSSDRP